MSAKSASVRETRSRLVIPRIRSAKVGGEASGRGIPEVFCFPEGVIICVRSADEQKYARGKFLNS